MWTLLLGDEAVVLRFIGKHFNVCFRTTTFRFCWFVGWTPHKTELLENPATRLKGWPAFAQGLHEWMSSSAKCSIAGIASWTERQQQCKVFQLSEARVQQISRER
jgi:hypothetical protein